MKVIGLCANNEGVLFVANQNMKEAPCGWLVDSYASDHACNRVYELSTEFLSSSVMTISLAN